MAVSVIIPARNAATTIAETLDSLLAQTHPHWQAIVIDDGSTDDTRRIAKAYAARDSRLRVIKGRGRGVSAARNRGIAATRFPWIYFLDADDTITPETLAQMVETLAADAAADAVHCGWIYTDPEGQEIGRNRCDEEGPDLFALFARYCAVAIHACMIRRALIERVGDFDETLRTSEDHDLWQRVARAGCRFVPLDEYLVRYRLRPQASWFDAQSFTQDVLQVIRRGHTIDPRLAPGIAAPIHTEGAPKPALPEAEFLIVAWAGAMAIARAADPLTVLDLLGSEKYPLLNSEGIAYTLFRAIPFTLCRPPQAWLALWERMRAPVEQFLDALEQKSGTLQLKARSLRQLEQYVVATFVDHGEAQLATIGASAAVRIDATHPISDLVLPEADRLICVVQCESETLGTLALPVCDGFMPAGVIADAVATRHAWTLLAQAVRAADLSVAEHQAGTGQLVGLARRRTIGQRIGKRTWRHRASRTNRLDNLRAGADRPARLADRRSLQWRHRPAGWQRLFSRHRRAAECGAGTSAAHIPGYRYRHDRVRSARRRQAGRVDPASATRGCRWRGTDPCGRA